MKLIVPHTHPDPWGPRRPSHTNTPCDRRPFFNPLLDAHPPTEHIPSKLNYFLFWTMGRFCEWLPSKSNLCNDNIIVRCPFRKSKCIGWKLQCGICLYNLGLYTISYIMRYCNNIMENILFVTVTTGSVFFSYLMYNIIMCMFRATLFLFTLIRKLFSPRTTLS